MCGEVLSLMSFFRNGVSPNFIVFFHIMSIRHKRGRVALSRALLANVSTM